jgi:CheY-like chemotaxis protein
MVRILVVDDYPEAGEAACVLFRLLGHDCQLATTGHDTLEAFTTFDPDIMLLDISLPDLSGYEVARRIRARGGSKRVFIAALTGWARDRAAASAAGIDLHVEKPPSRRDLEGVVAAAIARRDGATSADPA